MFWVFYNVCKYRVYEFLKGEGFVIWIMCFYYVWVYKLDGQLVWVFYIENLQDFVVENICLDQVRVEEFCGFVFVNFDFDV